MTPTISITGITLIAGGPVTGRDMKAALALAPHLVAADGGADRALALGYRPQAVFGDFDSFSAAGRQAIDATSHHRIAEQDSTDFDKALRSVKAPFVVGVGCLGGRLDHTLAVLNVLLQKGRPPCLLLGGPDVAFAAPAGRRLPLSLAKKARVSLFPLAQVTGISTGLEWPIHGLQFAPDGQIGVSNCAAQKDVTLQFDQPGMIVILPRRYLKQAIAALLAD